MDCPTCHQRIPEPRPLRDASPADHLAGRAVRAVLNELVGHAALSFAECTSRTFHGRPMAPGNPKLGGS